MYTSSTPVIEARSVPLELALSRNFSRRRHDAEWDIIYSALLFQLVYDVDVVCR